SCPGWCPAPRARAWIACLLAAAATSIPAQDSPAPARNPIDAYLQAIEETLALNGPYAIELVDLYYGYGQKLLADGDLKGARDAFHRTALVSRVNSGPNSLEQTNYLYSIAQVESMLGNFEESVGVLEHIYELNARHYGEDNPEMLAVVMQLQDWYSERRPLNLPQTRSSDIETLSYLAGRIADLTEVASGIGNAETAERYRTEGQIHFKAIYNMIQTGIPPQPELVMNDPGRGAQWYFDRTLSHHFEGGEMAYGRVVAAWRENPDSTTLDVAEAIAQLGDWYLALRHFNSAERQYEKAYELLRSSETYAAIADEYLGKPAPLRFMNNEEPFVRDIDAPLFDGDLEIVMTVSRNGRLFDIRVVNAPVNETQEAIQELTDRLQNTRFRPAVINGEVDRLEGYVWRPPASPPRIAARDH
ncbi:MAG: tetratricopeptide repeat protein, partial [Xanthomonadales bacterium]|nr:tetratricopeptide repeat protein [Xanthomonadales bacterium]